MIILPPSVVADMEVMVADGVAAYLTTYLPKLFPAGTYRSGQVQDIILAGVATAVRRYEATVDAPVCRALALALLDAATPAADAV